VRKEYTRIREVDEIAGTDPVKRLTKEMMEYSASYGEGTSDLFFHRKSHRVVLAVLHLELDGKSVYVRGINSEVSLPTGSICAERTAIVKARADYPNLKRKDMKGIAVLEVPFIPARAVELNNPLPPCGACREWLEKIQEKSEGFYVLTFPDLSFSQVHERFLFWSEEEERVQPSDLGPWKCRRCGVLNVPLSRSCRNCTVGRFSTSYHRAPVQRRFHDVLQALRQNGPLSTEGIKTWLEGKSRGPTSDAELGKTLHRLVSEREDAKTGVMYGKFISHDEGLYSLTDTGMRVLKKWNISNRGRRRRRRSGGKPAA